MKRCNNIMAVSAAAVALTLSAHPAAAAIRCTPDGFQIVQGQPLSTPYCQDALLASVARQYGMKASAASIRENPNYKRHVCRLVGQDIRVQSTCGEVNPNGRNRPY